MSYLDKLKKNIKNPNQAIEKLQKELEKVSTKNTKGGNQDDRFWKLEPDKASNGSAVIRFLPAPEVDGDDALPWVRIFDHGFQGPSNSWYIEKSLTTIGLKDPVSDYNSKLWNSGIDANKEIARKQKRRLNYYANILVVSDPKNPDNEGKVFLFKFGKKIFEKLTQAMNPEFDDEVAFNPFCPFTGADFKLKMRKQDGFVNYDRSEFATPKPIFEDDKDLEKLLKQEHSLAEFLDPKNFKTYEELKKRLDDVLGVDGAAPQPQTRAESADVEEDENPFTPPSKKKVTEAVEKRAKEDAGDGEDDEVMDYLRKLADE